MNFFAILKKKILDLIFPKYCVSCQKLGGYLCHNCFAQLNFFSQPIEINLTTNHLNAVCVMAYYEQPLSKLIHALKYQSVIGIGAMIGKLLWQTTYFPHSKKGVVTAVPIHFRRKQERGFNQAEEVAKALAQTAKLAYLPLLIKQHNTKHQAQSRSKQERLTQLKNSFVINKNINTQKISQVILVDDVLTTGTTLNECAKILKKNGIKEVIGLVVAHKK